MRHKSVIVLMLLLALASICLAQVKVEFSHPNLDSALDANKRNALEKNKALHKTDSLQKAIGIKKSGLLQQKGQYLGKVDNNYKSLGQAKDKYSKMLDYKLDSLGNLKKILTDKTLRRINDSIDKVNPMKKYTNAFQQKEVTKGDLVQAIRQNTSEELKKDSLSFDRSDLSADKLNLPYADSVKGRYDLAKMKLNQLELNQLPMLSGSQIKSKYLGKLDSVRSINLKNQGLKVMEKKLSENTKLSKFTLKQGFWKKSYLETIMGLYTGNAPLFQFSPSLAYHFLPNLSLGLGPNILIKQQDKKLAGNIGLRTFIKAEFWQRRVYAQVEDNTNPYKVNVGFDRRHNILAGGGFLFSVKLPITINVSVLYRMNNLVDKEVPGQPSPWVIRIGISSVKLKE